MSTKTKTKGTTTKKENLAALALPALWERFKEATGESTKSPNKKFLVRRIEAALAARASEPEPEQATPSPAKRNARASEPTAETMEPVTITDSAPSKQRGRFAAMTIEELQTKYLDVVGRSTGSDDRRYVELGDMWSSAPARRVLPRRAREATPHNRAAFSGGMTLRFPRPEACMATGAASWRSQGERA
jgi:hypothetical protein